MYTQHTYEKSHCLEINQRSIKTNNVGLFLIVEVLFYSELTCLLLTHDGDTIKLSGVPNTR